MKPSDIHIRAISQKMPQPSITRMCLKITCLKFHSNFPGANELSLSHISGIVNTEIDLSVYIAIGNFIGYFPSGLLRSLIIKSVPVGIRIFHMLCHCWNVIKVTYFTLRSLHLAIVVSPEPDSDTRCLLPFVDNLDCDNSELCMKEDGNCSYLLHRET